jgi:DNA polymerase-4
MASVNILHMDMDAFFASVEQLDNPDLKGRCVIVGGKSQRGVVAAASYEARRYGIHSAMPIFQAKQRCPNVTIVPPRRARYVEISGQVMAILRGFSPLVEPVSIDEAYMDISGSRRLHGSCRNIAMEIKQTIYQRTGLTCSIGVAPIKFLAKIASDMNKPDGLTIIQPEQVKAFIHSLPIRKVPGVGKQTMKILAKLGIKTLGHVSNLSEETLVRKIGKFGHRLFLLSQGDDDAAVAPQQAAKSVSTETTLSEDTTDRHQLASYLLQQAQSVAHQLRRKKMRARTVTLILKTSDFQRHTRSLTLNSAFQNSDTIYQAALKLLRQYALHKPVRLVGVGASGLQSENRPVQMALFSDQKQTHENKWEKVDQAVDALSDRFGEHTVVRGSSTGLDRRK